MKELFLAILFVLGSSFSAYGAEVTAEWNPNSESDLAGYKIYYGKTPRLLSGTYPNVVDVKNVTTYTVLNLDERTDYYFAATAYDLSGNESGYSVEAKYTFEDKTPPADPTGVKVREPQ